MTLMQPLVHLNEEQIFNNIALNWGHLFCSLLAGAEGILEWAVQEGQIPILLGMTSMDINRLGMLPESVNAEISSR